MQTDPAFPLSRAILQKAARSPRSAEKEAKAALKSQPKSPALLMAAGLVSLQLKKQKDARNHFIRAINTGHAPAAAYLNAGLCEAELGQLPRALELLDLGQKRFPEDTQLGTSAIKLCLQRGALQEAEIRIASLLAKAPDEDHFFLAGRLAEAKGDLPAALHYYALAPSNALAQTALSQSYAFTNQEDKALTAAKAAVTLAPLEPTHRFNLAWRKMEMGDFKEAAAGFRALLDAPEQQFEALRTLAELATEADIEALEAKANTLAAKAQTTAEQGHLAMARAELAEKSGDHAKHLQYLAEANRLYAKDRRYDVRAETQAYKDILSAYDDSTVEDTAIHTPTPIFITGMIRSGTTLLDRLLSASPEVSSMGEVAAVGRHFRAGFDAQTLASLRTAYSALQALVPPAPFTLDKMPENGAYLGWILRAFPNAKLIVMDRDPRDVAASAYRAYFNAAPMNFTFREDWLMQKMAAFEAQLAAWEARSVPMLRIDYDALVRAPEDTLAQITEYCGLAPIGVADLSKDKGAIRTASFAQARQPVNTASIGRWQKYQDLLPNICKPD